MHDDRCAWISPGQLGCCALKVQISFKLCETEAAFGGAALNLSDTAVRQFCAQPQQECRPSCAMMQRLVDSLTRNFSSSAKHSTCRLHGQPHLANNDDTWAAHQYGSGRDGLSCGRSTAGCVAEKNPSLGRGSLHGQVRDSWGGAVQLPC